MEPSDLGNITQGIYVCYFFLFFEREGGRETRRIRERFSGHVEEHFGGNISVKKKEEPAEKALFFTSQKNYVSIGVGEKDEGRGRWEREDNVEGTRTPIVTSGNFGEWGVEGEGGGRKKN